MSARAAEFGTIPAYISYICFPFQTSLGIMEMLAYNKEGTEQAVAALQREKDFLRNNAMVLALLIFLGRGF